MNAKSTTVGCCYYVHWLWLLFAVVIALCVKIRVVLCHIKLHNKQNARLQNECMIKLQAGIIHIYLLLTTLNLNFSSLV